jgi:hypothetical protein
VTETINESLNSYPLIGDHPAYQRMNVPRDAKDSDPKSDSEVEEEEPNTNQRCGAARNRADFLKHLTGRLSAAKEAQHSIPTM